jgi:hypothetical protein
MNVSLIDRIGAVALQSGIMSVDCFAAGPNDRYRRHKIFNPPATVNKRIELCPAAGLNGQYGCRRKCRYGEFDK